MVKSIPQSHYIPSHGHAFCKKGRLVVLPDAHPGTS